MNKQDQPSPTSQPTPVAKPFINLKKMLFFLLKGMIIGVANLIPGVSGATLAFILKIYQPLLETLQNLPQALQLLLSLRVHAFCEKIKIDLVGPVLLGIIIGIILFADLLHFLLQNYTLFTFAFFFGLILASIFSIVQSIEKYSWKFFFCLILGIIFSFIISNSVPVQANESVFYLLLCGVAAMVAMIIPGLSGSYILILLGNYTLILESISTMQIKIFLSFLLGAGIGLIVSVRMINWLFRNYYALCVSIISGILIGSLKILWPWNAEKAFNEYIYSQKIDHFCYAFPDFYDPLNWFALGLIGLGAGIFWLIEKSNTNCKK